jgi:hypothetical protein
MIFNFLRQIIATKWLLQFVMLYNYDATAHDYLRMRIINFTQLDLT